MTCSRTQGLWASSRAPRYTATTSCIRTTATLLTMLVRSRRTSRKPRVRERGAENSPGRRASPILVTYPLPVMEARNTVQPSSGCFDTFLMSIMHDDFVIVLLFVSRSGRSFSICSTAVRYAGDVPLISGAAGGLLG